MSIERMPTLWPSADLLDVMQGIARLSSLTSTKRRNWLNVAGSAAPADAWGAYKRNRRP